MELLKNEIKKLKEKVRSIKRRKKYLITMNVKNEDISNKLNNVTVTINTLRKDILKFKIKI